MDQGLFLNKNTDYGMSETSAMGDGVTVGQKLFDARQNSNETDIDKISSELCIRPHLLLALEQDDSDKFPSACYAVGFLKNYATYLGLNVTQIVAQYKGEFQGSTQKVDLVFLEGEKTHNHAQQIMVSLVILSMLVLYGVWYFAKGNETISLSGLPDVSEVTSNILVSATVEDQAPEIKTVDLPIEAIEEDPGFHLVQQVNATPVKDTSKSTTLTTEQVRLSVREDVWIRIIGADKETLVDRILLAGEEFYMTDHKDMTLMTSNAGAVSIFVGNIAVSLLGESGEIRDNISLNKSDLLMKTAFLSP